MNKLTIITGATSGIGLACAEKFASNKHDLIITGRREERLKSLAEDLQKKYGVQVMTLNFDIRNKAEVNEAVSKIPSEWIIEILINNAGLAAGLSTIQEGSIDDWEQMIDTNIKGLLYISKAIMPKMIEERKGHIINIGSIAGKEVYPKGNVYCASKHAVDALNQGMRIDLNQYGIRVGAIHPGMVKTEFSDVRFKGDTERARAVYQGFEVLKAEDIADIIYFVISRPYHVNIADLVVMSTAQATSSIVNRDN